MTQDREERIRLACADLAVPVLLSSPGRWRLVEDEEQLAQAGGSRAQERVQANANQAIDWIQIEAPRKLRALSALVSPLQPQQLSLEVRALVVITASRFISPRAGPIPKHFDLLRWTREDRNIWITDGLASLANSILHLPALGQSDPADSAVAVLADDLVDYILQHYIRPLFSSTVSGRINNGTGRAKAEGKQTSRGAPTDDETIWKGGDVGRARQMTLLGQPIVRQGEGGSHELHIGLGSDSVLFVVCASIAEKDARGDAQVWERYWPQVLPPLLQLLDDPSPRFRLVGSQVLANTLLAGADDPRRRARMGTLLLRTGVGQLFRSTLLASLTFISHALSPALLASTARAYIRLVTVLTEPINLDADQRQAYLASDGGLARFEQLSQLIEEGVLRVWAYAPNSMQTLDMEEHATGEHVDDLAASEPVDLLEATMQIVLRMTQDDALGLGIVRYLDLLLEFLLQQLPALASKVERWQQRPTLPSSRQTRLRLTREILAARTVDAMLRACQPCPAAEAWCARCITTTAQCWTVVKDAGLEGEEADRLRQSLRFIPATLRTSFPQLAQTTFDQLFELDRLHFETLLPSNHPA